MKMIRGHLSYGNRLRELALFNLEKTPGRPCNSLTTPKGAYKESGKGLFTRTYRDGAWIMALNCQRKN